MKDYIWFIYMIVLKYKPSNLEKCLKKESRELHGFYYHLKDYDLVAFGKEFGTRYLNER